MSDNGGTPPVQEKTENNDHLNIKVTDNNNEVFFKIKRTTALKKLMDAFCERESVLPLFPSSLLTYSGQGKAPSSVRFLFDGSRVQPTDSPDTVSRIRTVQVLCLSG